MGKIGITELLVLFIIVVLYLLPTYIAFYRRSNDRIGIFLLNLLTGWTFIGWIVSFIWAIAGRKEFNPNILLQNFNSRQTSLSAEKDGSFSQKIENVQKLKELLDSGAITQEEFDFQKNRVLS